MKFCSHAVYKSTKAPIFLILLIIISYTFTGTGLPQTTPNHQKLPQSETPNIICLNWVLFSVEDEPYTYLDFRAWAYVTRKQTLPPYALPSSLKREFLLDIVTLNTLKKMGIPFPQIREEELAIFLKKKPPDIDTPIIRTWFKFARWIRHFRDNQFKLTIQIHIDDIRQEYDMLYPEGNRPPLFEVYEELREKLIQKQLAHSFQTWQEGLLKELTWRENQPPRECRSQENEGP